MSVVDPQRTLKKFFLQGDDCIYILTVLHTVSYDKILYRFTVAKFCLINLLQNYEFFGILTLKSTKMKNFFRLTEPALEEMRFFHFEIFINFAVRI